MLLGNVNVWHNVSDRLLHVFYVPCCPAVCLHTLLYSHGTTAWSAFLEWRSLLHCPLQEQFYHGPLPSGYHPSSLVSWFSCHFWSSSSILFSVKTSFFHSVLNWGSPCDLGGQTGVVPVPLYPGRGAVNLHKRAWGHEVWRENEGVRGWGGTDQRHSWIQLLML